MPGVGGFRTIRGRMLFWVLVVTIPIYAAALSMSYRAAAERLEEGAARDADELAARLVAELDTVIRPIEGGIRTVARQLEAIDPPRDQYPLRIQGILAAWPDVYGSTIAVEVGGDARAHPFAPYYFRRAGRIAYSDLALDSYAYRELPWYRRAAESGEPVWSAPYFDAGGGETWMVTYSVPFYRSSPAGHRTLGGVVTADLDLAWMRAAAGRVSIGHSGVGWLAAPPAERTFVAPIGDTQGLLRASRQAGAESRIRALAERMLADGRSFELMPDGLGQEPTYLSVRNLQTLQWRLILAIPRSALLAQARQLLSRQLWLGAAGLLLLIAAISFVASGVARPIHVLAETVGNAEEGNLDFHLPEVRTRDETGVLAHALRRLRDSLKRHVELRAASLAAQARLEHELQIAASIQQSMLPREPGKGIPDGLTIAAALVPARQVGGDLYDYFTLRDGRLLFAVGDVSDKGIPAALFMARLSGLLRVLGNAEGSPDRLLSGLNERLVEGNDACMFATLGCGVLDPGTGRLQYASAGHDAPLLRRADGRIIELAVENGPAVGIDSPIDYRLFETTLAPGETLVLYTDGVTEARTPQGDQLSIERLRALIQVPEHTTAAIVRRVADAVSAPDSLAHADDDVTVLAVALNASDERRRLVVPGSAAGIERAQQWLRETLAAQAIGAEIRGQAELVAEEVLTNIAKGNAARAASVGISLECRRTAVDLVLVFRDDGQPFDPLAQAEPLLEAGIADRDVGGLGIFIVRRLASRIDYAFIDGRNVLTVHLAMTPVQMETA
jgi:sigma-B regulation protein RsbU (phosphoserine phosphatase)